jgi:hypothetical protein
LLSGVPPNSLARDMNTRHKKMGAVWLPFCFGLRKGQGRN